MEARATIAAIASAPGGGARAVIRLSGPDAARITRRACTRDGAELVLAERGGVHARLDDGAGDMPVLVLWMPAPRSLTGEDVVEWHVPGAEPLARAALGRALALGASPARPGEFLRRAFEHGRIDLTRAEGVLALVRAGNEAERRAASALLAGGLSRRVERLRDRLVEARALCEASLDFDEADTGVVPREELAALAREVVAALEEARDWEVAREAPSALPRVVLVGRPNAGKSSLFNRLSGAAALVSDLAGTTRDALESRWRPAGLEVLLWDAAGVDDRPETPETRPSPPSPLGPAARGGSPGSVTPGNAAAPSLPELPHADPRPDLEARERARHLRASADLWLWVVDASREDCVTPPALAGEWRALGVGENPPPAILVLHKADLLPPDRRDALAAGAGEWTRAIVGGGAEGTVDRIAEPVVFGNPGPTIGDRPRGVVLASARTGLGVADLERAVASLLRAEPAPGEARGIAARHRAALEAALAWARESFDWLASGAGLDLAAHAARRATDELDQIQGRTTPEDLLDRIFERFCIGK